MADEIMGPPAPPRQRPGDNQFTENYGTMDRLRIDGSDLAAINQYLTQIDQVTRRLGAMARAAHQTAKTDEGSLGDPAIGGVDAVRVRLVGTSEAVGANLDKFAEAVELAAQAMTVIARDFDSVDKRNGLTTQQVHEYLTKRGS